MAQIGKNRIATHHGQMRRWGRGMRVPINKDLVTSLIQARFGSVDELQIEWEHRIDSRIQKIGRSRDRATIYRWLTHGLPTKQDEVYGFAAAIGVDPIILLDFDEILQGKFEREKHLFMKNIPQRAILAPFWSMYRPASIWPVERLTIDYFDSNWVVREFNHDPRLRSNYYAAVYLHDRKDAGPAIPVAYHFAYRRIGARDNLWRPYGVVIGFDSNVILVAESGYQQKIFDHRSKLCVVVETFFGPGPASFRVASMNNFDLDIQTPSTEHLCVRFVA
jgi:hypothetical protein